MDAPIPPNETVENAYEHVTEQLAALKAHKPQTQAEQRRRAAELARLKQEQISLANSGDQGERRSADRGGHWR